LADRKNFNSIVNSNKTNIGFRKMHLCFLIISVLLGGCASPNGFKEFYRGKLYSPIKSAVVVTTPPYEAKLIGSSSFTSGHRPGDSHAIQAANSVGADYVEWSSKYDSSSTHQGVMPKTSTNYHSGTVSSSYGGYGNYSGTSTSTEYVPYSYTIHRYAYQASFFRISKFSKPDKPIGITRTKKENGIPTGIEWHYYEKND
jgi:hypothetical protein